MIWTVGFIAGILLLVWMVFSLICWLGSRARPLDSGDIVYLMNNVRGERWYRVLSVDNAKRTCMVSNGRVTLEVNQDEVSR